MFIKFHIGPLSFEFVSDMFFNFGLTRLIERTYLKQTQNLKDLSETL